MLVVLEPLGIILAIFFVVTQVMWPGLTGGQLFWIFRKDQKKVVARERELSALKTEEEAANLDLMIAKKKEELQKKKNPVVVDSKIVQDSTENDGTD